MFRVHACLLTLTYFRTATEFVLVLACVFACVCVCVRARARARILSCIGHHGLARGVEETR